MVCQDSCGGLWIGCYEIKKITSENLGCGRNLLKVPKAEGLRSFRNVDHICPECKTTLLFRHFFNRKRGLEVDQCSRCGGVWVEIGDLIETLKPGNKWDEGLDAYFQFIYSEKILKMDLSNADIRTAAGKILQVFKFLGMSETFRLGLI